MQPEVTNDINNILKNGFIQLGIIYAQLYDSDKERFVFLFKNCKSVRSVCSCVYWSYRKHDLVEEVKPEEGESKARFIGRKILKVIEVITNDNTN